jgi:hypothetical protein
MLVGASCTAELIQDDPGGLAKALALPIPVVPLELPSYQKKENWGASETFYRLVRALAGPHAPAPGTKRAARAAGKRPICNLLGPTALGFRHRDDVTEIVKLLDAMGVDVDVVESDAAAANDLQPRKSGQERGIDRGVGPHHEPFDAIGRVGEGLVRGGRPEQFDPLPEPLGRPFCEGFCDGDEGTFVHGGPGRSGSRGTPTW